MAGTAIPYVDTDVTAGGDGEPGSPPLIKYIVPPSLQEFLNLLGFPFNSQKLKKAEELLPSCWEFPSPQAKGSCPTTMTG